MSWKGTKSPKNYILTVRLTAEEMSRIEQRAKFLNKTVSAVSREMLFGETKV